MFHNYFTAAFRNITRHKLFSFINIAGLAVGLACLIFVVLFVRDEISYDRWVPDAGNLYRVEMTIHTPGRAPHGSAVTPFPLSQAMKDEIPEVTATTHLVPEQMTINVGDRQFIDTVDVVDPQFLKVIPLPTVSGDPSKMLSQPQSLVLSQSLAQKYFGNTDPIGRTVTVGNTNCAQGDEACFGRRITLTVTGVMRDLPHNSQLGGGALMPNTSLADQISQRAKENWTGEIGYSYLILAQGADLRTVVQKTAPIFDRVLSSALKQFGISMRGRDVYQLHLTPFAGVHLDSEQYWFNLTPAGSWTTVYGVGAVGVLILLIACFNFMNLATARATMRAHEISLRKCVGATRSQLIVQFLGESVLMALMAAVLALALVETFLSPFDSFMNRPITINYLQDWRLLLGLVGISVAAGLLSGSYPAFVLSGIRPAHVLRTNSSGLGGSGLFRAALVVFQFAVSIGFGIAVLVVFSQIRYSRHADLGFQKDRVLILSGGARLSPESRESLSQSLRANSGILDTALSNKVPFGLNDTIGLAQVPGKPEHLTLYEISIDPDFARVYQIHLIAGRTFSRNRGEDNFIGGMKPGRNDGHNIILNAAGAARLGFTPQQAVGKTIIYDNSHVRIIGVMPNVRFDGSQNEIKPTVYYNDANQNGVFSVRLRGDFGPQTVAYIDRTWHSFVPAASVDRYFLDESFDNLYITNQREGTMFSLFVGIAIFIACLGLFGLAAFTASRRSREIGLRKVFGARTRDVAFLLLWQFSVPVLIANAIAWPVAWYWLHGWLEGYAYRIALSPLYFLAAGIVALVIAWATICTHAWRVASANPIHALRYE